MVKALNKPKTPNRKGELVAAYVSPEIKNYLVKRGERETRTISNLLILILGKAMRDDVNNYDK